MGTSGIPGVLGGFSPAWHLQHLSHPPAARSPPGCPPSPSATDSASASPQSRDRKVLGDYSGALSYGSTAKWLNITALVINILIVVIVVTVVALIVSGVIRGTQPPPYGPS